MKPLDREESRRVDRWAQEQLDLPGELLMENAGAHVARSALELAAREERERVLVIAGPGNNGGDGFVAARQMIDEIEVSVLLVGDRDALQGDALANCQRWECLGEEVEPVTSITVVRDALAEVPPPLVLDALFGTGLSRPVDGLPRKVIEAVAASGHPVLSVDLPSGLDCNSGEPLGACIRATRTVSFVAPKIGFGRGQGAEFCGEVQVAPIGFPPGRAPV